MAPPIETMPLSGLHLLRNMSQGGWSPQVAYGREAAHEYWQVVGTWGEVRAEGWWRRPTASRAKTQWRSLMVVTVRGSGHDPADFRSPEPRDADADARVPMKVTPVGLAANVLSPQHFTTWVTARMLNEQTT